MSTEKPKIEMVASRNMYTIELCNPIKEKINNIKICGPNIEIKPCNPIAKVRCLPEISCLPIIAPAELFCGPVCPPKIEEAICGPTDGPCSPGTTDLVEDWRKWSIFIRPESDFTYG